MVKPKSLAQNIQTNWHTFTVFCFLFCYHGNVKSRDGINAEEAEFLQNVLIYRGDGSLIFVKDAANNATQACAAQEGQEDKRVFHHLSNSLIAVRNCIESQVTTELT